MFIDTAKVIVCAGNGGRGAVSFRHEKYIDKGGPDGGNGGRGGDVIFVGDENTNTLVDFRYHPELKASNGTNGSKRNQHGKKGEPLLLKVPLGTVITNDQGIVADILKNGQKVVVAKGGEGGFGNAHFKSSTRQTPRVAEVGEPGETFEAKLELKLIADVGLVGFPNAGKSTFLSVVSNARPEIADYAFTTLTPNLGVAEVDGKGLLIADIPGLIEGASKGKGLGGEFLRHVERTSVLLHLIDAYTENIESAYQTIRQELKTYSPQLIQRKEIVAITKVEGLDQEIIDDQLNKLKKVIPAKTPLLAISSRAHIHTEDLLRQLLRAKSHAKKEQKVENEDVDEELPVISLTSEEKKSSWKVSKVDNVYIVSGEKIEKFARKTDANNPHSLNRLRDIMRKLGVSHELERLGAKGDSEIQIANITFSFIEQ